MAKQQPDARERSESKRDNGQESDPGTSQKGDEGEVARYENELASFLEQRIRPGLNGGAIPMLARSIAKEIAHEEYLDGASEDGEADDFEDSADAEDFEDSADADDLEDSADADDFEDSADADDFEDSADADDFEDSPEADDEDSAASQEPPDLDTLHELQAELGEDWIVRFCIQGDDAWLTAEKEDGSQYLEAPTGSVLAEVVGLLNERGGRF